MRIVWRNQKMKETMIKKSFPMEIKERDWLA